MSEFEDASRAATEVAKAGGKIADATGKAIDASIELGNFLSGSSIKSIPRAVISLLGGDWIIGKQVENIIEIQAKLIEKATKNNLRLVPESLPWRIKVEAIRGMADEDDGFLQEKWSQLLISAMRDDDRRKELDRIVLDTMRRLTPQSARLLIFINDSKKSKIPLIRREIVIDFSNTQNIENHNSAMIMDYLAQLRCVQHTPSGKHDHFTSITTLGRAMIERLSE